MMKRILFVVAVAMLAAGTAYAGDYNDAGCGLGSLVFRNNSRVEQVLAVTTNGTSANQMFGITSGTSGCTTGGGLIRSEREGEVFAAVNFRSLSRELAAGHGEYATALATLMGCSKESGPAFLSLAKAKYETLFPTAKTTATDMLKTLEVEIAADPGLSQACTL